MQYLQVPITGGSDVWSKTLYTHNSITFSRHARTYEILTGENTSFAGDCEKDHSGR